MTKRNFLAALQKQLTDLPNEEVEERLAFYSEMIDDRIEEGSTEEAAVAGVGSVDAIAAQILAELPRTKQKKAKPTSNKRLRAWEIVLLAVGSPIWLSLAIAAFAVLLALYAVLWSLVISLWAVFVSLAAGAIGGVAAGAVVAISGHPLSGIATVGAGLVCAALAILFFFGCHTATKGGVWLTKAIARGIKRCFVKKEESK